MASIQYVVNATDAASGVFAKIAASADGLDKQLEDLGNRIADPEVTLDDSKFTLGMIRAAERLDKLSAKVADPSVDVDTGAAQREILRINAMLDRLGAKKVTAEVNVDVNRGILSRIGGGLRGLLPGASSAAGGAAQAAGGAAGGVLSNPYAVAGLAAAALTSLPFLAQAAAGAITTVLGGALVGVGVLGASSAKKVKDAFGGLKSSVMTDLRSVAQPFVKALGNIANVAQSVLPTFMLGMAGAMKILAPAFSTFADALLRAFGQPAVIKAIQAVAGAFAAIMRALAPQLAGDIKAVADGISSIAGAIKKNPRAFADLISFFFHAAGFILTMLGALTNAANYIEKHFIPALIDIRNGFKDFFHWVAGKFDEWRHWWAGSWDQFFQWTVGRVIRGGHDIEREFNTWRHNTAAIFDGVRHDIAHAWDVIWNNTVARVRNGISDVIGWFKGLPSRAMSAINGLGTLLWNFGHMALSKMWNGMKSAFDAVWSWFKSLPGKLLSAIGIHSPPDWAIQAGKHIMGGLLHGITSRKDELMSRMRAISEGAVGGAIGGGVQRWSGLVRQALAMEGLSPMLAGRVLYQMQTESGGNPNAINNWDINARDGDPSRGLMQVIGTTFAAYHWPGTSWDIYNPLANIAAALNYARHVYGPSLMSGGMGIGSGHGYAYGTAAAAAGWAWVGERGPELVRFRGGETVRPSAAGNTYNITVQVPPSANKADIGRQVVETIREYERRSGNGWRR